MTHLLWSACQQLIFILIPALCHSLRVFWKVFPSLCSNCVAGQHGPGTCCCSCTGLPWGGLAKGHMLEQSWLPLAAQAAAVQGSLKLAPCSRDGEDGGPIPSWRGCWSWHKQPLFVLSMGELLASPAGCAMGVTWLWVYLFPADNTAAVHTQRVGFNRQEQDVYLLPILVVDSGPPALSSTGTLTIRICGCDSSGAIQSCNSTAYIVSATLSPGALIALLVCILILVGECSPVPRLLLSCPSPLHPASHNEHRPRARCRLLCSLSPCW